MFDRICAENGIRHLLTAPYSPTTTGKVERLHKTMRAEFFTEHDREFATVEELQAALDGVGGASTTPSGRTSPAAAGPPAERFALADRSIAPVDSVDEPPVAASGAAAGQRRRRRRGAPVGGRARADLAWPGSTTRSAPRSPASRSRSSSAGGLVEILHAGVLVATHAQRLRAGPGGPGRRGLPVPRRARDATAGLTVTRLADGSGVGQLRRHGLPGRPRLGPAVASRWRSSPGRCSCPGTAQVIRVHPIRHDRARELGAFANPKGRPRRKNSAIGTVA